MRFHIPTLNCGDEDIITAPGAGNARVRHS